MGQEGVKLLGAPIGSQAFQKVAMEEKVYKLENLMDKLSLLEDPHTEYAMLKSCFALPKLSFLMRTVDPRQHQGDSGQVCHSCQTVSREAAGGPLAGPPVAAGQITRVQGRTGAEEC